MNELKRERERKKEREGNGKTCITMAIIIQQSLFSLFKEREPKTDGEMGTKRKLQTMMMMQ